MKIFKTKATAKAALKRNGILGMAWEFENHCSSLGTGIVVNIYVHDMDDFHDVMGRGFVPILDTEKAAG